MAGFCLNSMADPLDFLRVEGCVCMCVCLFSFGVVSGFVILLSWRVRDVFSSSLLLIKYSSLKTVGYTKELYPPRWYQIQSVWQISK